MRSNINRRNEAVAQLPEVEYSELEYDDGEIVIMTIMEEFDRDRIEQFAEDHGMEIVSGPKHIGIGVEVILG